MLPLALKSFSRIDLFGTVRLLPLSGLHTAVGLGQGSFRLVFLGSATFAVVCYVGNYIKRIRWRRHMLQIVGELKELREGLEEEVEYDREDRDLIKYSVGEEQSEELLVKLHGLEEDIEDKEQMIQEYREMERKSMEILEQDEQGVGLNLDWHF
jgi:hypothetical protein